MRLNHEQEYVVSELCEHIAGNYNNNFRIVSGYAGTGKTTCLLEVIKRTNSRTVLCAPTNKAVRVIRDVFQQTQEYQPPSCTIYSLLGLTLLANGEVKEISGLKGDLDFSDFDTIVIDEAGMLNRRICSYIDQVAEDNPRIRWILQGDPAQLPPVNEKMSPVWELEDQLVLTRVMRTDNQILTLATHLRELIDNPGPLNIGSDNDGKEGVWSLNREQFHKAIIENCEGFNTGAYKAVAWRNDTVESVNRVIRNALVGPQNQPWLVGERITLLEPAKSFMDDSIFASTDEEGVIVEVTETTHPLYRLFKVWHLRVDLDTGSQEVLYALHEDSKVDHDKNLRDMAERAKKDRRLWRYYWNFKDAFHKVRHAWSTTAHKSQGSTYQQAFVCWRDIMANRRMEEALRCLYVATTRPKERLYVG